MFFLYPYSMWSPILTKIIFCPRSGEIGYYWLTVLVFEEIENWEQLLVIWNKFLSDIRVLDYKSL